MSIVDDIREKVRAGRYEYSKHAVDQSIARRISVREVREALLSELELVEDYPDDYYGPSCLVPGFTKSGRPLHVVCNYPSRPLVRLITIHEPDPSEWTDFRKRL
ncbi:MAG: DUF4258 domain-containing protein [Chitinivibrionales bacterium]|nr:DUF4258 domain-containing protein [Chitinivibrionales bacterium]